MATSDPHKPLRQNIRMLGDILGSVITTLEGESILDQVRQLRELSQQARTGDDSARTALLESIRSLDSHTLRQVAKAFNQFLNLANLAEQHHRVRRRRVYRQQNEPQPQPGSLEELMPRLQHAGVTNDFLMDQLLSTNIDFVLTAHPTETQRRTMIQKYDAIADCLGRLDREDLTAEERRWNEEELHRILLAAWRTDEVRSTKPTPVEEARWGFAVVEQTLWDAVPAFLRNLDHVLEDTYRITLPIDYSPIRFSSWMGGDRDGNPNVTAEVTREVLLLGQWEAAELLIKDLELLRAELSQTSASDELRSVVGNAREPYRALLRPVIDNLQRDQERIEDVLDGNRERFTPSYPTLAELNEPLMLCYRSLIATDMVEVADGRLKDILRKLACFGPSLLRLDIRQDAGRHTKFIDNLTRHLGVKPYRDMDESERQTFLLEGLQSGTTDLPENFPDDPEDTELLATFRLIAEQDPALFGPYIISMAKQSSDILAVRYLQALAGITKPLQVVPLFETLADLEAAGETIDHLLQIDWYRKRIDDLQVMIGYSDSAKDAGFLAASWAQYKALEALVAVCQRHGVPLTLFHGRGGTISRGGASAHQALLSQPPGAVRQKIRVTEQGEVIRYKFGLPGVALRSLEVYLSAALEAALLPPQQPEPAWRETMEILSRESAAAYRKIVRDEQWFMDYFHQTTPIRELQEIAIGSRPAKRKSGQSVDNLRAIPWVFGWTQVRLMLPAWLGTQVLFAEKSINRETVCDMLDQWVYFASAIGMQEMVLAKTLPDITELYERELTDPALHEHGKRLRDLLHKVTNGWLELTGRSELLSESPIIKRSIAVRNPYTDVLNLLQIEALKRYRSESTSPDPDLRKALLLTIVGIAAGMRNTG